MISRRHIPFASADENSGALFDRPGEIPAWIIDRIRRRNERGTVVAAQRAIHIGGLRSRSETGVRFPHDANETGKSGGILKLSRDLMQAGFLERNGHEASGILQRFQGPLGSVEIATQQDQHWRLLRDRIFCFALKTSAGTRGVSVEIRRRMRQRRFPGAVGKFLGIIMAARIEDGETKIPAAGRFHRYSSGFEGGGGVGRRIQSFGISSLGWTASARRISFFGGVGVTGSARRTGLVDSGSTRSAFGTDFCGCVS